MANGEAVQLVLSDTVGRRRGGTQVLPVSVGRRGVLQGQDACRALLDQASRNEARHIPASPVT